MLSPSRLRVARKRRGLNKARLAEAVGLDLRAVTALERGDREPRPETLGRIARALDFPPAFFTGPDLHEPTAVTASFRSLSRMSAAVREGALAAGAIAFLLNDWIEARFDLPTPDLLDLGREEPEAAAITLRRHWGLGEAPVRNMVHLLEARGVRVFSLAESSADVDAFSLWREGTPFTFLNTLKSAEHGRFDAAHELGHLVLHRHGGPQGREAEGEANRFAAAFLMPRGGVLAEAPRLVTPDALVRLKHRWTVSAAALNHRLHALGLVDDGRYRSLCIEIAARGWRTVEPEPARRETSQLLAKVFAALRDEGVGKAEVARRLHLDERELDRLVFGLVMVALR